MARKKIYENIEITDTSAEGKAVGRFGDRVVFVKGAVPGDLLDVRVTRKKKSFMEGVPFKFHKYSDMRIEAFCSHFDACGGCKWQFLSYDDQLKFKHKQVAETLSRVAKVNLPEIRPIIGSEETKYYRNKMEFTFSNKRWLTKKEIDSGKDIDDKDALGFHIPGRFDKILDIEHCYLQGDPSNAIRLTVRDFAKAKGYDFFDIREQEGLLRNLIIRTSTTGEVMVILVVFKDEREKITAVLDHLEKEVPGLTSLQYIINPKKNDSIADLPVQHYKGETFITEKMPHYGGISGELTFKIGPKSFYQTNPLQAKKLYELAASFAGLQGNETVYDLYTGTGTIANHIAPHAEKVIGIEYVPEAIEDAKGNSVLNKITNTRFFAGDMKAILTAEFIGQQGKPDVIITDPPRAGMHKDVVNRMLESGAEKIVYVSCNPSTQARDIAILDEKYKVSAVQPVDMFPHTHHVENVALLELRDILK